MKAYTDLTQEERLIELAAVQAAHDADCAGGYKLDMTRGKPSPEQLDWISSLGFDEAVNGNYLSASGTDVRNYGDLLGIPEARRLFADTLNIPIEQLLVSNNSSLNLMYDLTARALLHPLPGADEPWERGKASKVLCPSPGYDRHFAIAESFGMELIPVPMTPAGPDMDVVEEWVKDPQVKLMFCVPKYSNPDGIVYSEETCRRMAAMETAGDFRIIWDDAYHFHHLDPDKPREIPAILDLAARSAQPDRFFVFVSTSKVTYAGAGISALAASPADFAWFTEQLKYQTIGPDKVNQLRHVRFFEQNGGIESVMRGQARFLAPRFDKVLEVLDEELGGTGLASWQVPEGGYFIGVSTLPGLARRAISLCAEAGVKLTAAGATWPGHHDPNDSSIRLAPSYPSVAELETAVTVLAHSIKLAYLI